MTNFKKNTGIIICTRSGAGVGTREIAYLERFHSDGRAVTTACPADAMIVKISDKSPCEGDFPLAREMIERLKKGCVGTGNVSSISFVPEDEVRAWQLIAQNVFGKDAAAIMGAVLNKMKAA